MEIVHEGFKKTVEENCVSTTNPSVGRQRKTGMKKWKKLAR
jgi:hypothetical protein